MYVTADLPDRTPNNLPPVFCAPPINYITASFSVPGGHPSPRYSTILPRSSEGWALPVSTSSRTSSSPASSLPSRPSFDPPRLVLNHGISYLSRSLSIVINTFLNHQTLSQPSNPPPPILIPPNIPRPITRSVPPHPNHPALPPSLFTRDLSTH